VKFTSVLKVCDSPLLAQSARASASAHALYFIPNLSREPDPTHDHARRPDQEWAGVEPPAKRAGYEKTRLEEEVAGKRPNENPWPPMHRVPFALPPNRCLVMEFLRENQPTSCYCTRSGGAFKHIPIYSAAGKKPRISQMGADESN
jgi:hypothetical protein